MRPLPECLREIGVAPAVAAPLVLGPVEVQRTGTALRSLVRFLHLRGMIDTSLVGAHLSRAAARLEP